MGLSRHADKDSLQNYQAGDRHAHTLRSNGDVLAHVERPQGGKPTVCNGAVNGGRNALML